MALNKIYALTKNEFVCFVSNHDEQWQIIWRSVRPVGLIRKATTKIVYNVGELLDFLPITLRFYRDNGEGFRERVDLRYSESNRRLEGEIRRNVESFYYDDWELKGNCQGQQISPFTAVLPTGTSLNGTIHHTGTQSTVSISRPSDQLLIITSLDLPRIGFFSKLEFEVTSDKQHTLVANTVVDELAFTLTLTNEGGLQRVNAVGMLYLNPPRRQQQTIGQFVFPNPPEE